MTEGPDFMCAGLLKAGTSWLYDQLDSHPSFAMPPVKELQYFTLRLHVPALASMAQKAFRDLPGLNEARERHHRRPLGQRDLAFLRQALALRDAAGEGFRVRAAQAEAYNGLQTLEWEALVGDSLGDVDGYASLFEGGLSGDITPAYSMLGDSLVQAMAARFPELKIVLMIRDPVARACSELAMLARHGRGPADLLDDLDTARAWLDLPEVQTRSKASEVWRRWSRAFSNSRVFFFDDLCERPEWLRREIAAFLGAGLEGFGRPANFNRKEASAPPAAALVRLAAERLADELDVCAETFGGPALRWRQKYFEAA